MILSFHYLVDRKGRPTIATFHNKTKGTSTTFPLYHLGTGFSLYKIDQSIQNIGKVLSTLITKGNTLVISDLKSAIEIFDLKNVSATNIYDKMLPVDQSVTQETLEESTTFVEQVAEGLINSTNMYWHKLLAGAGVVYHKIEERGIVIGGMPLRPIWGQRVFSGRSSTSGFNIQGTSDEYEIENPTVPLSIFLHFDWSCADIRIAGILSEDKVLQAFSLQDDPYTAIAKEYGIESRAKAKVELLRAINSMDPEANVLKPFGGLREWIVDCRRGLSKEEPLESVLGRKFRLSELKSKKKNPNLAIFNATMQGSIAHAMHQSIINVWEEMGEWLLCEIHDSIIVTCPNDKVHIKNVIRKTTEIMLSPFEGQLSINHAFPVRVSVGKKWRKWKEFKLYNGQE